MSQVGYTPIILYASGTATNTPTSGNLASGELAINYADGKLFYKDSSGVVQVLATKATTAGTFTTVTTSTLTSPTSTALTIQSAGTTAITVDTSQNVGIGTTSPSYKLQISGASVGRGFALSDSTTGSISGQVNNNTNQFNFGVNNSAGNGMNGGGAYGVSLESNGAYPMAFVTNATERMRIDSSGNVGIGTTGITGKFHVAQTSADLTTTFQAATNAYAVNIQLLGNDASGSRYNNIISKYGSTEQWYIGGNGSDATLAIRTGGTERMRIDSSGNLLVGKSATTASTIGMYIGSVGDSYWTRASNGNYLNFYNTGGTQIGYIQNSGNSATVYSVSSDQSLKTNIQPSASALDSILNFPVDQFDWIETGTHQEFGAVAQKVLPIIPEMVSQTENGLMGIDWSKAVPRMIKTIQEQQALIESLTTRLTALESK